MIIQNSTSMILNGVRLPSVGDTVYVIDRRFIKENSKIHASQKESDLCIYEVEVKAASFFTPKDLTHESGENESVSFCAIGAIKQNDMPFPFCGLIEFSMFNFAWTKEEASAIFKLYSKLGMTYDNLSRRITIGSLSGHGAEVPESERIIRNDDTFRYILSLSELEENPSVTLNLDYTHGLKKIFDFLENGNDPDIDLSEENVAIYMECIMDTDELFSGLRVCTRPSEDFVNINIIYNRCSETAKIELTYYYGKYLVFDLDYKTIAVNIPHAGIQNELNVAAKQFVERLDKECESQNVQNASNAKEA